MSAPAASVRSASALEVEDLVVSFPSGDARGADQRTRVVDRVSLRVAPGETVALVGESGCGKSMTALSILRLVPRPGRIESGIVRVGDREIQSLPATEMRRVRGRDVAMIFQEPMTSLNPVTTVGSQVVEAIRLHAPLGRREARERAAELLGLVGIGDPVARLDAFAHQLSGGMKQRVMIAMALASHPRVLVADEPTTALDVTIQAQILALLRRLQAELGMAMLLITHDLLVVSENADRVAVMYAGRIVEVAPARGLLTSARHPYTQGLVRSLPARAPRGARLQEIEGSVPPARDWVPGCHFTPRCPRAFEPCPTNEPGPIAIDRDHTACCHAVARDLGGRAPGDEPGPQRVEEPSAS